MSCPYAHRGCVRRHGKRKHWQRCYRWRGRKFSSSRNRPPWQSALAHETEEFGFERITCRHRLERLLNLQEMNVCRGAFARGHESAIGLAVQFMIAEQRAAVLAVIRPVRT